jgi:hypothetical protein
MKRLERWAERFPERRWAVENAGGLGRHLAGRLAASGESVVDVPPKLSARVRMVARGRNPVGPRPVSSPYRASPVPRVRFLF